MPRPHCINPAPFPRAWLGQTSAVMEAPVDHSEPIENPRLNELVEGLAADHFDQSRQLFVYLVYFLTELARYAETDSMLRLSKHLPTDLDKNVNIKLAGNEVLWKILEHESFKKALATDKPQLQKNTELIKKLYQELAETPEYKQYIVAGERDRKTEKEIL